MLQNALEPLDQCGGQRGPGSPLCGGPGVRGPRRDPALSPPLPPWTPAESDVCTCASRLGGGALAVTCLTRRRTRLQGPRHCGRPGGGTRWGPPHPGACSETHGSSIPGAQVCRLVLSCGLPATHTPTISQITRVPEQPGSRGHRSPLGLGPWGRLVPASPAPVNRWPRRPEPAERGVSRVPTNRRAGRGCRWDEQHVSGGPGHASGTPG